MENYKSNTMRPSLGSRFNRTLLGIVLCLIPGVLLAQTAPATAEAEKTTATTDTTKTEGRYFVQNSVEFGGRITSVNGNEDMYKTLMNLQSGPRLLDQSTVMRSLRHDGTVFDQLWINSFGYGGDPEAGTRVRMSKNRIYDFSASYRSNKNYFNDNYLDNPYNTPGGAIVWNTALHQMDVRRQMGDFHLTLFPESKIRLRLGYVLNDSQGDVLSSFHEGTELSLAENYWSRQNQYQIGVDFKFLPHTMISYDQFFDHTKNNGSFVNNPQGAFYVASGSTLIPVDIGAIYNTYYGQPCSNIPVPILSVVNGQTVVKTGAGASGCNMYFDYNRSNKSRADFPTERLSLTSNWKRLDVAASTDYTSASNKFNYLETADGYVSRTFERGFYYSGPGKVRQISSNSDLGVTFHISDAWYLSNQLKYTNWRIPGSWDMVSASCGAVGTSTTVNILSPIGGLNNPYCSLLGSNNVSLTSSGLASSYTNDDWSIQHTNKKLANTTILGWDPNKVFGVHAGFRYAQRTVSYSDFTTGTTVTLAPAASAGTAPSADTSNAFYPDTDHEKAGLFGVKVRPNDHWLINGDVEILYIDHPVAAILPGHRQNYKVRSTYRLTKWGSISAFASDTESRNSQFSNDFLLANLNTNTNLTGAATWVPDPINPVRHTDHNRNYGASASIHASDRFVLDFGWTYQDLYSRGGTCMPMTLAIVPQGGQIARCPAALSAGQATNPSYDYEGNPYTSYNGVPVVLKYQENTNTGYVNMIVKPVERVSVLLGYAITSNSGANTWLRADTMAPFMVPVDANGNVVYAGNTQAGAQVGYAPGPNPAVGPGPLGLNWHLPSVGLEVGLTKAVVFKGVWNYYDYHEKSNPGNWIASRDFQTNTGTLSLRYTF